MHVSTVQKLLHAEKHCSMWNKYQLPQMNLSDAQHRRKHGANEGGCSVW